MVIIISFIGFLGPKKRREAYVLVPPVILGMNYFYEMHSKNQHVHWFKYQNKLEYRNVTNDRK